MKSQKPNYYIYPGTISLSLFALPGDQKMKQILQVVKEKFAEEYNCDMDSITDNTRARVYATARMVFYYYARKYCPKTTLEEIGKVFQQSHSTVIRGVDTVQQFIDIKQYDLYDLIMSIDQKFK